MKTLIAALLALCLIVPCALAEQTRTETIILEGMQEQITLVPFVSDFGYTFWYDPDTLKPLETDAENTQAFEPSNPDAVEGVSLSILSMPLETADYAQICQQKLQSYEQEKLDILLVDPPELPGALEIQAVCGTNGDMMFDNYTIKGLNGIYEITIHYPIEAAEGYGSRINQFLQWIENL